MKLYMETRNKFFKISVIILLISLVIIFKFKINELGYFLLGIFASTLIIAIQSNMSAKIEESKLLIGKLKKLEKLCRELNAITSISIEEYAEIFEHMFKEIKETMNELFITNTELGSIPNLNEKTKQKIDNINEKILDLQIETHFIIKHFKSESTKMRIMYFIEIYKILKEFDFDKLNEEIRKLGMILDEKEFYNDDYSEKIKRKMSDYEYENSLQIYNKKIEKNNNLEYKALRNNFERFIKEK